MNLKTVNVPEENNESTFKPPEIWMDDDEMYSLMQRIKRPRHIDPLNFDRKVLFWQQLIEDYALHNRIIAFSEIELQKVFSRYFVAEKTIMYPECLPQVLNAMLESKIIQVNRTNNVLTAAAEFAYEWIVKKPVLWTWSYFMGNPSSIERNDQRNYGSSDETFIITKNLHQFTEGFFEQLTTQCSSIIQYGEVYIYDDFENVLQKYFDHDLSREVIQSYLLEKSLIKIENSASIKLVYLRKYASTSTSNELDPTILSSIAHLRITMRKLHAEEIRLSAELVSRKARIKQLLRENRRSEAVNHLRRSKQMEAELNRKMHQITSLEQMEMRIAAAKDNKTVVLALADASSALKRATGGAEGVVEAEQTMDEMVEIIEDTNTISKILSHVEKDESDSDLENELEKLLEPYGATPKSAIRQPQRIPSSKDRAIEDDEILRQLKTLESINLNDLPPLPESSIKSPVTS